MAAPSTAVPPGTRVLAIVGPTGTGKTELACEVARRSGGEVISADSVQVYRFLDVGTAKPAPALRAEIPHHAIDVVDPDDLMSAGRFAALARCAAADIVRRGHTPILCGGTGLYARAFAGGLVQGMASDPALRAELETRTTEDLRRELESRDPAAAARIHLRDRVRIARALEALRLAGRPLSAAQAEHRFGDRAFDVRWLGLDLPREDLWARLRQRSQAIFQAGLVDEVRALHARGYGPALRSLQSIGYRQAASVIEGQASVDEAVEATFLATRRYAKRQRTWFRAEPGLRWTDARHPAAALSLALSLLERGARP